MIELELEVLPIYNRGINGCNLFITNAIIGTFFACMRNI